MCPEQTYSYRRVCWQRAKLGRISDYRNSIYLSRNLYDRHCRSSAVDGYITVALSASCSLDQVRDQLSRIFVEKISGIVGLSLSCSREKRGLLSFSLIHFSCAWMIFSRAWMRSSWVWMIFSWAWKRYSRAWMRSSRVWMRYSRAWMRYNRAWLRSSRVWMIQNLAEREWDLAECGWDLAEREWDLVERGWDLAEWLSVLFQCQSWKALVSIQHPPTQWNLRGGR
jgi:hypothetical protein